MQPLDVAHFIGGNVRRLIKPQRVLELALGLAEAPSHRVVLTRIAVAATAPIGVVAQLRLSMRISFPPDHDGSGLPTESLRRRCPTLPSCWTYLSVKLFAAMLAMPATAAP